MKKCRSLVVSILIVLLLCLNIHVVPVKAETTDSGSVPSIEKTNIREEAADDSDDALSTTEDAPLFDVQQFNSTNPIILYFDTEVTLQDIDNPIEGIILAEYYDSTITMAFEKYTLENYIDSDVTKSKLALYPETALDNGKYYKMSIAGDVMHNSSGTYVEEKDIFFVIKQDDAQAKGIYGIDPSTFKNTDFSTQSAAFTLFGYNFNENIKTVTLETYGAPSDAITIEVENEDVTFINTTEIEVEINGSTEGSPAQILSSEENVGSYTVSVQFDDASGTYEDVVWTGGTLDVEAREKPNDVIKSTEPSADDQSYNEKDLNPTSIDGATRYFIKVVFNDEDGSLAFDRSEGLSSLADLSSVYAEGTDTSFIDTDFLNEISDLSDDEQNQYIDDYIFVKDTANSEASLCVPVILLASKTTYEVSIVSGVVYYSGTTGSAYENDTIQWEFTTAATPVVKGIVTGTVPENYDEDIPIIITGNSFYGDTITVYFNDDIEAEKVKVKENSTTGETYLEVYLPDGNDRLDPGVYSITVQNDDDHQRIDCGTLSVVKAGDYVPNEQYKVKGEERQGKIRADLQISADTLVLKSKYADEKEIELDLDEIMGQDVLVRKIQYRGSKNDVIDHLATKSKWCDIDLYGLTLDTSKDNRDIVLNLGRAEPAVVQMLKNKLRGKAVKSEFIQVTGQNFEIDNVVLNIPFYDTNGQKIEVLRYDEETRNFYGQGFTVDTINKTVEVISEKAGIFFIVE